MFDETAGSATIVPVGVPLIKGLGIDFVDTPKPCCFDTILKVGFTRAGQRTTCFGCRNTLTGKESLTSPMKGMEPAEGFDFISVAYGRRNWQLFTATQNLGQLRKDCIEEDRDRILARQNPTMWFEPSSIQIVNLGKSRTALVGQRKGSFAGKKSTAAAVRADYLSE